MSGRDPRGFIVEIGTEELPPKALRGLMDAFANGLAALLESERLEHGAVRAFASPRRLAVHVAALALAQPDRDVEHKGPPVAVAFDRNGKPTRAAEAFAGKCGVAVDALERVETPKGAWLVARTTETGQSAAALLPELVQRALDGLPIPRRMRWGSNDAEFVRPVHWVLMLHGTGVVPGEVLGIRTSNTTRGHRFHAPEPLTVPDPDSYETQLKQQGFVIADFAARRQRIEDGVHRVAAEEGGTAIVDSDLYDEVTALTEWPVAMAGHFDERYLTLPREVIIATLTGHQRYFPVAAAGGGLLPKFITVANLESLEPERVRDGNERVIEPRLADAAFFWESDRRMTLASRQSGLASVVYQRGLGTLEDKSERVASLAARIADALKLDADIVRRAARLAKCDLLCGMVGEFPELQGTMGGYYAAADGEPDAVAMAIAEQYMPRFSGDKLPQSAAGKALAFADKLDTICGAFALGSKPSGNRDPFGLRRAAQGIVRIAVEGGLDAELIALIDASVAAQPASEDAGVRDEIYDFIVERLRGLCLDRDGVTSEMFDAVRSLRPASLCDIVERLDAVVTFSGHEAAEGLAAANKRIANILRQAEYDATDAPDTALFDADAERALYDAMTAAGRDVSVLLGERRYTEVLARLAELRQPVDAFFDGVMVMTDDEALRKNRLALLAGLRAQFLNIADISRLAIGRAFIAER
ncbi:MAG: glycine--tRNA ligase subunit beta [Woeseia sp.]